MSAAYVVRSGPGALRAALPTVLTAVVVVVVAGVLQGHHVFAGLALVLVLGFGVAAVRRGWTRLRVDEQGLTLSVPVAGSRGGLSTAGAAWRLARWPDVRRVVVSTGSHRVQVVLRHDAPMPSWMTARVYDPRDPGSGISYDREVPGLDPAAFELAVRRLAPHVEVATRTD